MILIKISSKLIDEFIKMDIKVKTIAIIMTAQLYSILPLLDEQVFKEYNIDNVDILKILSFYKKKK